MKLDPTALDAAALNYEAIEDALTAYEQQVGDGKWSESGMRAAITAYQAAMAEQVRAAVKMLVGYSMELAKMAPDDPRAKASTERARLAHTALLALLGAEETA